MSHNFPKYILFVHDCEIAQPLRNILSHNHTISMIFHTFGR